jgi:hypothetical protein
MVRFREATDEDNQQLIQLTATAGMAGDVGLRIDRKPDFFALLKMRGTTKVYIDEENDKSRFAISAILKWLRNTGIKASVCSCAILWPIM